MQQKKLHKNIERLKKFKQKLFDDYRFVIFSEETFAERFSVRLTRLNVFVIMSLTAIILVVLTTVLIAFSPLKEYIPGYSSTSLKRQAARLSYKTDSLQQVISDNEKYFSSIKNVLKGEIKTVKFNKDSLLSVTKSELTDLKLNPSLQDSLLRAKVDSEDKYNLFDSTKSEVNFSLYPPAKGTLSEKFNSEDNHYAVDVVLTENTPIKSVADGVVVLSEWTTNTGFVIIVDHGNGLISSYKHNASLTKKQGDLVEAGEVIAVSGNTGDLSTGPHLHFELWSNGYPVDPTNFIDFE